MGVTTGTIVRVNGPVVDVAGMDSAAMLELVEVGDARLPGEIIALDGGMARYRCTSTRAACGQGSRSRRAEGR